MAVAFDDPYEILIDLDTDHHSSFMDHLLQELRGQYVFYLLLRCNRMGTHSMMYIR